MRCRCVLARFHLVGVLPSAFRPCRPHFFVAPHPTTPNNKKGYLSVTFFHYWSGQWDWRCRCVLARFHLIGVLSSASRPCRPHFFVAPHPATPNNKKRLPFGNLLLLLERAMGFGPTTSTLATKKNYSKGGCYGHFITLILRILVCFRTL